jgi:hypothetical protein
MPLLVTGDNGIRGRVSGLHLRCPHGCIVMGKMTRSQIVAVATALIVFCALPHSIGKAQTLQDLINEACAPSHYPFLPPCSKEVTLDEINNRLNYRLNMSISSWEQTIGLLYVTPTQRVWDSNKNIAMTLSTPLVRDQLSKAIDAFGVLFLTNTNGDAELVRKNILWHLIATGWDKERIAFLSGLKEQIDPKLLFHVEPPP